MTNAPVVFSPLRVVLMIMIAVANLAALVAFVMPDEPWSDLVGLFGIVFIMMFVFVILLEMTWLHHRGKHITDSNLVKHYRLAKIIYLILLISGIIMGMLALL